MKATIALSLVLITTSALAQRDSLACEKEYAVLNEWRYSGMLREQYIQSVSMQERDSLKYSVLNEKGRKARFTVFNSKGQLLLEKSLTAMITPGSILPCDTMIVFKLKSRSLFNNSFVVTMKKKDCKFVVKEVKPGKVKDDSTDHVSDTVLLNTQVVLASKLNMRNKQELSFEVDSLVKTTRKSELKLSIRSQGGEVDYKLMNSDSTIIVAGRTGEKQESFLLKGSKTKYILVVVNNDLVAAKHVQINVRQLIYRRVLKKPAIE